MSTQRDDIERDDEDTHSRTPRTDPVPPDGELPSEFVGGPENMPGSQAPPPEAFEDEPDDEAE